MTSSSRDFQLAVAKLIASPQLCVDVIRDEDPFFSNYDLTDRDKRRLHAVLRQKGISACCSLYRMNRVTPVYMQLANTSAILGDDLIPILEEFWKHFADTTLQYKAEVLEFGKFLMKKIKDGTVARPYLKEVLQMEVAINELSYLPEGEERTLTFAHDIIQVLASVHSSTLSTDLIEKCRCTYKLYMRALEIQIDLVHEENPLS
ncbi:MAG: hypothetical protein ABI151_11375 [Chitinophagaceae bacterium]